MDHEDLIARVRELRAEGATPKGIARALGMPPAQVRPLIREVAASAEVDPPDRPLVGCWINSGWNTGLTVDSRPEWLDDPTADTAPSGVQGLVAVLLARRYRWGRVSVCGYLVDVYCLGVKNALGPEIMSDSEHRSFASRFFAPFPGEQLEAPLELAQNLVFGAVDYARGLGFEPHPDFAPAVPYLGAWSGSPAITFGHDGVPFYIQGPDDNARHVLRTLERTVGEGKYRYEIVADGITPPW